MDNNYQFHSARPQNFIRIFSNFNLQFMNNKELDKGN
jgi:hypothetical protein